MGQVTRIDRREITPPENQEEAKNSGVPSEPFYGRTAFEQGSAPSQATSRGERPNPLFARDTAALSPEEESGIERDLGKVGEEIKKQAPNSRNVDELKKNVSKAIDSWVVQEALREFGKLKQKSQIT